VVGSRTRQPLFLCPSGIDEMAYARFQADHSDVYVLEDVRGFMCCMRCALNDRRETRTNTRSEMIAHLEAHLQAGQKVPDYAFEDLKADIAAEGDLVTE
jgi:hypothetical protein